MGSRSNKKYRVKKQGIQNYKKKTHVRNTCKLLAQKNKEERYSKTEKDDSYYRKYIVDLIINNIKSGKSEEEALEIALADEVVGKFEYLEKNGLDIKECFRSWARGYAKRKKELDIFKEEHEK